MDVKDFEVNADLVNYRDTFYKELKNDKRTELNTETLDLYIDNYDKIIELYKGKMTALGLSHIGFYVEYVDESSLKLEDEFDLIKFVVIESDMIETIEILEIFEEDGTSSWKKPEPEEKEYFLMVTIIRCIMVESSIFKGKLLAATKCGALVRIFKEQTELGSKISYEEETLVTNHKTVSELTNNNIVITIDSLKKQLGV